MSMPSETVADGLMIHARRTEVGMHTHVSQWEEQAMLDNDQHTIHVV